MILLLLLALNNHHGDAKHAAHHAQTKAHASCHVYATKGPFKGVKTCK
ncbi:hypothetical protein [Aestuariivirga litoralis]|nr:hypothetical protein [Aestuariivirga litoralis]